MCYSWPRAPPGEQHYENPFKRYLHDQIVITSHRACSFHLNGYVYIVGGEIDPHQVSIMNGNIFQYTDLLLPIDKPDPLCVSSENIALVCGKKDDDLHCFSFNGVNRNQRSQLRRFSNPSLGLVIIGKCCRMCALMRPY